jgi:hypothetical protein
MSEVSKTENTEVHKRRNATRKEKFISAGWLGI